jgi:hypothetical protein
MARKFFAKALRHKEGFNFMGLANIKAFCLSSCLRGKPLVPACPG